MWKEKFVLGSVILILFGLCFYWAQSIAELLRLNAPMAMKLAFDDLKGLGYKTRDTAISDVGGFDSVELSVLLCNDEFIQKLNKEWRDEDHPTDVLSMSQHVPGLKLPIVRIALFSWWL